MKTLIHETPEASGSTYQLWAELSPVANPSGYQQLTFSSVWTGAKDPEAPQVRGQFLLGKDSLNNLRNLLDTNERTLD